jgi:hypothetical protein
MPFIVSVILSGPLCHFFHEDFFIRLLLLRLWHFIARHYLLSLHLPKLFDRLQVVDRQGIYSLSIASLRC